MRPVQRICLYSSASFFGQAYGAWRDVDPVGGVFLAFVFLAAALLLDQRRA